MDPVTLALLIAAICAIVWYARSGNAYFEKQGVPYVPPVPFLGNMAPTTFRRKHINWVINDLYNYAPDAKYVGVYNFGKPVLMIRDLELIKMVTVKHFDNFPDHQGFVDVKIDPMFGGNLFGMTGEEWREARNLLSPAFTSSKMKAMYELMVKCANNYMEYFAEQAKIPNNELPIKDIFSKYSSDVISTCAFGYDTNSLKDPNNEFYVYGKEATNFEGILSLKLFMSRAFPFLMKLFRIKIVPDHIKNFFMDIVAATIKMRDEKGVSRPDMIQLMMEARGKTSDLLQLDITQMTAQAFVFFFAGYDTTSSQMCAMALELALNPDIQARLQAEIDEALAACNNKPTYEVVHGLAYLEAVFYESLRKHAQAHILDRVCKKSFELLPALPGGKPFVVRPGMNIWVPISGLHHDENLYPEPDKFDPERFLGKKLNINQVENLGFGIGPRSCIGNRFALLETKIMMFNLLSKFTLKPGSKTSKTFEYKTNTISIIPKGGYWITVEPRKNLNN